MTTFVRSALVALAFFGAVSAASAAPRYNADRNLGVFPGSPAISDFDAAINKAG
ncbi:MULTISPECIES: hypothetical protein [Rhodomicrobium]|uniref:hypothetical protein n=1 Tax=Rhodomicrobium TaxID=1068 RepID=UPI0014824C69|nr:MULTISPECIES: hypothetical protein [Rhodomicrobium]